MDARSDLHQKVPVLGFGGTGCGLMGAGMLRSYSNERLVSLQLQVGISNSYLFV